MLSILTYGLQLKLFPKKVRIGPKMSKIHEITIFPKTPVKLLRIFSIKKIKTVKL